MVKKNGAGVAKADLDKLEQQLDQLVGICTSLKDENDLLRERQATLVAERAQLIEQTELARTNVEAMLERLKTMADDT